MKKGYKRLLQRGIEGVILELGLISCGFNLHRFHLKILATRKTECPFFVVLRFPLGCFFTAPFLQYGSFLSARDIKGEG